MTWWNVYWLVRMVTAILFLVLALSYCRRRFGWWRAIDRRRRR
jgi:hypothetical protein